MYIFPKEWHIDKFKSAILSVSPEYYKTPTIFGGNIHSERIFAYELYHQLRLLYNGYSHQINGEFRKGLKLLPDVRNDSTYIPDLIIHEHNTNDNNALVAEIKTDPNLNSRQIVIDLEKLELLTRPDGGLDYQIGVLLICNCDFKSIFFQMKSAIRNKITELLSYQRLAIWNIYEYKVISDDPVLLDGNNLKIFRTPEIESMNREAQNT